jgi:hypothetical protein
MIKERVCLRLGTTGKASTEKEKEQGPPKAFAFLSVFFLWLNYLLILRTYQNVFTSFYEPITVEGCKRKSLESVKYR